MATRATHGVLNTHHALVTLLARHQFGYHCAVLLVHRRFVRISTVNSTKLLVGVVVIVVFVIGYVR